jgi:hypothetical protein
MLRRVRFLRWGFGKTKAAGGSHLPQHPVAPSGELKRHSLLGRTALQILTLLSSILSPLLHSTHGQPFIGLLSSSNKTRRQA